MNVSDAMANPETRSVVLARALREMRVFQDKYANLSELAEVMAAIKKVCDGEVRT